MRLPALLGGRREAVRAEIDYSDAVVEHFVRTAAGLNADPLALLLVQACIGLHERTIAAGTVEPVSSPALAGVSPSMLATVGRDLATRGASVWVIRVSRAGRVLLLPAATYDISGGPDPMSWTYRLDLAGPSATATRQYSREEVLHFRMGVTAREPWRGASPLQSARTGFDLAGAVERVMGQESKLPTSRIVSLVASRQQSMDDLAGKISRGGVTVADAGGADVTGRNATQRLGMDPTQTAELLRSRLGEEICAAFGLSPVLFAAQGDGSGQREAWRRYWAGTVAPVGRIIEAELREQLDPSAVVHFRDMRASDEDGMSRAVSRRAAAYKTFREAGMEDGEARRLAGLES